MYNDKPPNGAESMNHGHTKGELAQTLSVFFC